MKFSNKDCAITFIVSLLISASLYRTAWEDNNYPVFVGGLLLSCLVIIAVKNQIISYVLIAAAGIGVSFISLDYIGFFYPVALFIWSVRAFTNNSNLKVFMILSQLGFFASMVLGLKNLISNNTFIYFNAKDPSLVFSMLKDYASHVILFELFIVLILIINANKKDYCYVGCEEKLEKAFKPFISVSYIWLLLFAFLIGIRYGLKACFIPLIICFIYLITLKEPMLCYCFNFFQKKVNDFRTTTP